MKKLFFGFIVVSALLAGCATVPADMATPEQDADAKRFSPAEGTANVYIARKNESAGMAASFKLVVDDTDFGLLYPGTYQMAALAPGKHRIAITSGLVSAAETVSVEAGKNYFYSTGAKDSGSPAEPEIGFVLFEKMGRLMISQSKRAAIRN